MRRTKIHEQILSGTPLLSISSRFPPLSKWQKIIYYCAFFAGAILLVAPTIKANMPWWLLLMDLILIVAIVGLCHVMMDVADERKHGMLVSDTGVTIGPYRCALWHEITAWDLRAYSGLRRVSLSKSGEGVSLSLFVDDLKISQGQFSAGRGGSAFADQGYYFDEDQQATWQKICAERNIPRWQ
jgi:hypothetical protein